MMPHTKKSRLWSGKAAVFEIATLKGQHMRTFKPPKPWNPDSFRVVCTSLADHTLVDQRAIPWCTTHDAEQADYDDICWKGVWRPNAGGVCVISTGGPDHKWWKDV